MYISTKYKSVLFFIFLFYYFISPLNAATLKINNGFEGDLGALKCSGNCPKISTSQKKSGKSSADFTLTRNMKTKYRTEVVLKDYDRNKFDFGKEYWMSLDYRYEDWKKDKSEEFAPFQVHVNPSSWDKSCKKVKSAGGKAPFFMTSKDGQVSFKTFGSKTLWKGPIEEKKWLNIVVHFKISYNNDGFIEAWKDGVKIGRVNGSNSFKTDNCGLMKPPYLKMGVYKWGWIHGATDSSRRQLLIDNFKIAEGSNGYSLVSSGSAAPAPKPASKPAATKAPAPKPASKPAPKLKKDVTPPVIRNIQALVTGTNATITWSTNEASNSLVKYGLNSSYNLNVNNNLLVTSHKMTLKNLAVGKVYHYQVSAKDSSGNRKTSSNLTFKIDSINNITKEGLVAHWLMEKGTGTAIADNSGNGHTGKLRNGARLINGEGVKFDGVNDYFDAGKLNIGSNSLTLSAWFWADDLSNCRSRDCRIISKATGTSEQDHYFMVSTIKAGSKTRLRFRLKTNGRTSTLIAASGDIVKNQWVHVAAVYDGQTMRLYKDGIEVGSRAKKGGITTNSKSPVWIGGNPSGATSRPWKGHIGNVRIYSYPLTNREISVLAGD